MATHTYRFSEFQAGLVESGQKTMTIRAPRKAPTRVGDTLRLTGPVFAGFGKMAAKPGRLLLQRSVSASTRLNCALIATPPR